MQHISSSASNTCTQKELEAVSGVGPALSAKIVAARPFHAETVEAELMAVNGIAKVKCAAIMAHFGM